MHTTVSPCVLFFCGHFLGSASDLQSSGHDEAHSLFHNNDNNNDNNNRIQRRYLRCFTISSQRRELSPTCTLKWPGAQPCANHVQHIERLSHASVMLHATWYEGTTQLLSLTELKSHLFELYFIGWTIKTMKEGRKPEYSEKTPGDELQKMPYYILLIPQDSSPKWDSDLRSSIGGRLGKQTC